MSKQEKFIIGLVGEIGSGKETFAQLFRQAAPQLSVSHHRFSDILYETLRVWDIETNRRNLQMLTIVMREGYGPEVLNHAVGKRIENDPAQIVILDGVRWQSDVKFLKQLPNNRLVYITAEPEIRFNRVIQRKEKAGEEGKTFEQFQEDEQMATETEIPIIGKTDADFKIINNGTLDNYLSAVKKFIDFLSLS